MHKPSSLSLILFPVPLVKRVLGDIRDKEEFLVWLGGGGEEEWILYPEVLGLRSILELGWSVSLDQY